MVDILYEDNQVIVAIKPQNMPSQLDETNDEDILSYLKEYIKVKYEKKGNVFLGLVHRLDRPTGGVMVFARTSKAAKRLAEEIKNGDFKKEYLTVVLGNVKYKNNRLVNYLKKDTKENIVRLTPSSEKGAKRAELIYSSLEEKENIELLKVEIFTGRSHQIRVQLSNIGNPVFGDAKYGGDKFGKCNLALWAFKLSFKHPTQDKMLSFTALPPQEDMPWKMFNFNKIV